MSDDVYMWLQKPILPLFSKHKVIFCLYITILPNIDFFITELYLEPKFHVYGPNFLSGRIDIARALGNDDLLDGTNNQIGSNCLESGVTMGNQSVIAKRYIKKCYKKNWSNGFHNYTFIWSPGKKFCRI